MGRKLHFVADRESVTQAVVPWFHKAKVRWTLRAEDPRDVATQHQPEGGGVVNDVDVGGATSPYQMKFTDVECPVAYGPEGELWVKMPSVAQLVEYVSVGAYVA